MAKLHQDEPVLVTAGATAAVGAVMTVLVTHGVITSIQASALTQSVLPPVVAGGVLLAGLIARRFVTPFRKVEDVLTRGGLLSDADHGRIEAAVSDALHKQLGVTVDWPAERAALVPLHQAGPEHQLPGGGGLSAGTRPHPGPAG